MRINVASILAVAALGAMTVAPTVAQASPFGSSVRTEIAQTKQTVRLAERDGQVNLSAGRRLARRVDAINRQAVADRQYGRLSAQERTMIFAELNRVNFELAQAEHGFQR